MSIVYFFNLVFLNNRGFEHPLGEYTYVNWVGVSVVDLCCISMECLGIINNFRVMAEYYSDPILISFSITNKNFKEEVWPILPKLY